MEILWLAILFYSVGLAAVLHYRPALMFNENGTWKEFGYHRASSARYTLFPVWLFAITWAIVSYTLAAAIIWAWRAPVTATAAAGSAMYAMTPDRVVRFAEDEAEEAEDDYDTDYEENEAPEVMVPVSEMTASVPKLTETIRMRPSARRIQTPARQPRMGYYVLDPASEKSGLRRYIYYGAAPPPEVTATATARPNINGVPIPVT